MRKLLEEVGRTGCCPYQKLPISRIQAFLSLESTPTTFNDVGIWSLSLFVVRWYLVSAISSQNPALTPLNIGDPDKMNTTQYESHMQFDQLGETYDIFGRSPFRQLLEYPTTFAALGDISGLSILDYGCGSGVYTRLLKRKGARRCVGIDPTPSMIEHAQSIENSTPLGVEYVVMDDSFPNGFEGTFDIVLAVYVLPFMTDVEQLEAWFRNAAKCLRPGGRLVAISGNPDTQDDRSYFEQYGFRLYRDEAPEGTEPHPCKLDLCYDTLDNKGIQTYLWTKERLENASKKAGFGELEWRKPVIQEGQVDQAFWERILNRPNSCTFRCTLL